MEEYDSVLCIHPLDAGVAVKAINALHHFLESRNIFLITKEEVYSEIKNSVYKTVPLQFLDEDYLTEDLNLQNVREILCEKMGVEIYPNWYYQQFLKMAVALLPEVAEHYLIWDSDTILLRSVSFFDEEGRILFNPQSENHKPYFEWMEDVLGIKKQVDYSFIDHNLMIKKSYMNELIQVLRDKAPDNQSWYWLILHSIKNENITNAGFSEFETYGNFVFQRHENSYKPRPLRTDRRGARRFGQHPELYEIFKMMNEGLEVCTFESWDTWSVINVAIRKVWARLYYTHCLKRGKGSQLQKDAKAVAGETDQG